MRTKMSPSKILSVVLTILCFWLSTNALFGQQKLAQTGMKFLSVATDAKAESMGEAVTSLDGNSESMFFNPSGMARMTGLASVAVGQVDWIADIKHVYLSAAFSPFNGDYGVIGFTFRSTNYGDLQETIIANNAQGFLDVGTFSPSAYAGGIGYAKALSDKFAVGANINLVHQDLGSSIVQIDASGNTTTKSEKTSVVSFDFGLMYKTGFKSLAFGMDLRNFSRELTYEQESFQLPLTFKVGVSMNVLDLWDINSNDQSLTVAADASHPRDNIEQLSLGGEYTFEQLISLRGGYMFDTDETGWTAGIGVRERVAGVELRVDYSYTPFGVFTNVQRFSFGVTY